MNPLETLKIPLEVLVTSASATNDIIAKISQVQATSHEKSSRLFSKLPASYQRMFLITSSTSEVQETEINNKAKDFF